MEKDFLFPFQIYFPASFAFYFLVLYIYNFKLVRWFLLILKQQTLVQICHYRLRS